MTYIKAINTLQNRIQSKMSIPKTNSAVDSKVKLKITQLLEKLNNEVYEKQEAIALSLLSSIAGESIFLLGAPGVAKSLIARKLKYAFKGGHSFDYLMNRFSTPDEIFGPVSITKLKNEDKYERKVEKYLPTSTVVFLDEIWKAGPSIQNTLLTVLNEKVFRNGDQEINVPIKALIAASNELPMKEQGLEALWDRFLVRLVVEGVQDESNFNEMISKKLNPFKDSITKELKISDPEIEHWSVRIDEVIIPEYVFNVIKVIRNYLNEYNEKNKEQPIYISDRRWKKVVRLLRTSAFLNDRNHVDLMDCFLIQHCIWNETTQRNIINQYVAEAIRKHGYSLSFSLSEAKTEIKELEKEIKKETVTVSDDRKTVKHIEHDRFYEIVDAPDEYCLIEKAVFDKLSTEKRHDNLYRKESNDKKPYSNHWTWLRKGNDALSIEVEDKVYHMKTTVEGYKETITKEPHSALKVAWDKKVDQLQAAMKSHKDKLNSYKEKDLKNLRTNLFVDEEKAEIVEHHLQHKQDEIEKIAIDLKSIQNNYQNLKNDYKQEK